MSHDLDRRTLLGVVCAGCAALATGCGSRAGTAPAAGTSSAVPSPAGGAPSAGTPGPTSAVPPASTQAPAPLAVLADIPVGRAVSATTTDGKAVILSRTGASTVVGFSSRCPHQGCTVAPAGESLACPCHGSRFAVADGSLVSGPAPRGLSAYAVKVVGNAVLPA